MADNDVGTAGGGDGGVGSGSGPGASSASAPGGTPLDQPHTPEQLAQIFASDPPLEPDPLGQAILTLGTEAVAGGAAVGVGALFGVAGKVADVVVEHLWVSAGLEAAENLVDEVADVVKDWGGPDQGASGQAGGDQSSADQTDQGSGDQPADESEPAAPDTTEPPSDGPGIGQTR